MAGGDLRRRRRIVGLVARRSHRRGRPRRRVRARLHGHRHGHIPLGLRGVRRQLWQTTDDGVVPEDRGPVHRADRRRVGELHDEQRAAVRRLRRPHRPSRDRRGRTLRPRRRALRASQRVLGDDEGLYTAADVGHRPRGGGSPAHPGGAGPRRRDGAPVRAVRRPWGLRGSSLRTVRPAPDSVTASTTSRHVPSARYPRPGEHDGAVEWDPRTREGARRRRGRPSARRDPGGRPHRVVGGARAPRRSWPASAQTSSRSSRSSRPDLMRFAGTKAPGDPQWWEWGPLAHAANTNKRGITLDLTRAEGHDLALRLWPRPTWCSRTSRPGSWSSSAWTGTGSTTSIPR